MPQGLKSIAALRRGLEVLAATERLSAATLLELHGQTLIPKATLLRILKTLQEAGWVRRDATSGRYLCTPAAGQADDLAQRRARLTALAEQPRAALQRRLPWPSDLAVRHGHAMLVLDTHKPVTGLSVNYRVMGFRPHMLASALGRCYLACCPEEEREQILAVLARSPLEIDQASRQRPALRRMVAQARQRGYAARDPGHAGADLRMAQRFSAIAVPVHHAGAVVACLGCAWPSALASEEEIVHAHLPGLRDTAKAISERLRQARFPWPA
jgi:IclR family mhp operon transcriptional activator